ELASFRLRAPGATVVANGTGPPGATSGPTGPGIEEESQTMKPVEQIPAHLLHIRQMYAGHPAKSQEALEAEEGAGTPISPDSPPGSHGGSPVPPEIRAENLATPTMEEMMVADLAAQEEYDEDALLKRELAKLRTGEDVIAFFAKNGSNTPVKFVYCKRKEILCETDFRPYDLEVIAELMDGGMAMAPSKLGEHFTISATGVVHVCPGQQSEHMSLGDWMHQCLMYSVLTSMNFFKYYIHGKVFTRWQQHTRFTVYCHARASLVRRLFLAKPMFVQPLVRIHSLMHEVESVKVMSVGTNVYLLADFAKEQASVRSNTVSGAAKELEARHDSTVSVLDKLVDTVSKSTEPQNAHDEHAALRPRMKSMVQEKKEARDDARRHQLALHDQGMLGDCVRLVDYMFQACLVKVVVNAAVDFFHRMETASKMFSISVAYGDQNMVFEPCLSDHVTMLEELWRGSVQVVNTVPSFLSLPHFDAYVIAQLNHQTVESILNCSLEFNHYTAAVRERIESDINQAQ
ncbi:unnamed protein product, partial [Polarella glacialis]